MIQTIAIDENQADFLKKYSQYGFKTQDLEQESLEQSASLYAEIYADDEDLQELTESALAEKINE